MKWNSECFCPNACLVLEWKTAEDLLYYVLWWSRSVKTWPPSSASVPVRDSCCLSCCHWSQATSCKPSISAVFPRLIIPSLCLYAHTQRIHLVSTLKHLSISCQTHTHLGIFFLPFFFVHRWCWHCFLTHSPYTYKQKHTHTHTGWQTEWWGRGMRGQRRNSGDGEGKKAECRKSKRMG